MMCAHLKSINRKIWEVVEKNFAMLDPASPTAGEEEKLQHNDITINLLYEALDFQGV
jgi:hypothetical protein